MELESILVLLGLSELRSSTFFFRSREDLLTFVRDGAGLATRIEVLDSISFPP